MSISSFYAIKKPFREQVQGWHCQPPSNSTVYCIKLYILAFCAIEHTKIAKAVALSKKAQ